MDAHFRRLAQAATDSGDEAQREEWLRAAERMDWEAVNEMTVRGARYRVVRADTFIRRGPAGPEPPRATDSDPGEAGWGHELADPAARFVIDTVTSTGMAEGMLKVELLEAIYPEGSVPAEVRADSVRAVREHPGGVLLPAAYTTAELADGQWKPTGPGTEGTPQGARDSLAFYLRVFGPWRLGLDPDQRAVYAAAADRLDAGLGSELEVAGRRFRVVRVERLARWDRMCPKDRSRRTTTSSRRPRCGNSGCVSRASFAMMTRTRHSNWTRTPRGWPSSSARKNSSAGHAWRTGKARIHVRACKPARR